MTEDAWLTCTDPQPMLDFLRDKASDRKLRLFACACVRRVWSVLPPGPAHEAVRLSEAYADGKVSPRDLGRIRKPGGRPVLHPSNFVALSLAPLLRAELSSPGASALAVAVTRFVGWECRGGRPVEYVVHPRAVQAEATAQAAFLRDIVGNPFGPVALDPAWQTHRVVTLARVIYDERAFDRLPVLADALEEAGCDNEDILAHLRSAGPHVRGCWPLDLLLGKS